MFRQVCPTCKKPPVRQLVVTRAPCCDEASKAFAGETSARGRFEVNLSTGDVRMRGVNEVIAIGIMFCPWCGKSVKP